MGSAAALAFSWVHVVMVFKFDIEYPKLLVLHTPDAPNALRLKNGSFVSSLHNTIFFITESHRHEASNVFQ
jgi:hypothetical protein